MGTVDSPDAAASTPPTFSYPAAGAFTVHGAGEMVDAAAVKTVVASVLDVPPGTDVVVNLSAVTYLTMEAVVPLLDLARTCVAEGRTLRILASSAVRRKLETMGLSTTIPLESSLPPG